MKSILLSLSLALFASSAQGLPSGYDVPPTVADLIVRSGNARRSLPDAPDGYTPAKVQCPSNRPSIRSAATLSQQETDWLQKRRANTVKPLQDFLGRMNVSGLDTDSYVLEHQGDLGSLPNIAIALSGGGYRALLNGGGAMKAFDSRTPGSTGPGQLGGLLQASTYVTGLSGGSWLVGSIFVNNFTSISALQEGTSGSLWEFSNSILEGPKKKGLSILNSASYYKDLVEAVNKKDDAGFKATLTDLWARALSYQLVNATDGGPSYTWSSISEDVDFAAGNAPMPIVVADTRAPNQKIVSTNATIFEYSPFEFGSFDPTTYGFAPLKYLGSNFDGGVLPANTDCIAGFDNAGFVMGTSSSLFNDIVLKYSTGNVSIPGNLPKGLKDVLGKAAEKLDNDNDDIANYPNPFYHYNSEENLSANSTTLTMVDGGEDNQNIPFAPLLQPQRAVDVIFAIDSSSDLKNDWPDGGALVATYERAMLPLTSIANGTSFPSIPDTNTFINRGFNSRPTFFGCNSKNTTNPAPLVVYLPNSPYVYNSNVSTFDLKYSNDQRDQIIENGRQVATQGDGAIDASWPTCVACAVLSRSFERTNTTVPLVCAACFQSYCWDGQLDTQTPPPYDPSLKASSDDEGEVVIFISGTADNQTIGNSTAVNQTLADFGFGDLGFGNDTLANFLSGNDTSDDEDLGFGDLGFGNVTFGNLTIGNDTSGNTTDPLAPALSMLDAAAQLGASLLGSFRK